MYRYIPLSSSGMFVRTARVLCASLALAGTVFSLGNAALAAKAGNADAVFQATPPGITLQIELRQPPTVPLLLRTTTEPRFGDASGMTLYIYEKDTLPNQSVCTGECAQTWPPAEAPVMAKPVGEWTIVGRADGIRQWAYRGKPLYRSTKDMQWGETKGHAAEENAWRVARPKWHEDFSLPTAFSIREVAQAPGRVLATAAGLTLYTSSAKPGDECASPCDETFAPFVAPQAAKAPGDAFTFLDRVDGIRQWAYQGQPLYTFSGDVEPGDQNGNGIDKRYTAALLVRYFVPSEVAVRPDQRFGGVWTTRDGMTLYARETARYPASGATHARGGTHGLFQEGLAIGIDPCAVGNKARCEEAYRPLLASASAQPSGYWTLYPRPDGTKQWAYQGYALYTFANDTKPGEMNGRYDFDIIVNDSTTEASPARLQSGLFWRISTP